MHQSHQLTIFVRVGWMSHYDNATYPMELPVGGGAFNTDDVGSEYANFRNFKGRFCGYVRAGRYNGLNLKRIDPSFDGDVDFLRGVLVIIMATDPVHGGQKIVGWYRDAKVFGAYQQRDDEEGSPYLFEARRTDCTLLTSAERTHAIPGGPSKPGQSNVFYVRDSSGKPRKGRWIDDAIDYVNTWTRTGSPDSEPEVVDQIAVAASNALEGAPSQGYVKDVAVRSAIEQHAMDAAKRYYRRDGYRVEDVHATRSYDLECTKGSRRIFVEVKGTTGDGKKVIVTPNEVSIAQKERMSELFILHTIQVKGLGSKPKVSKGTILRKRPWNPRRVALHAIAYLHDVEK